MNNFLGPPKPRYVIFFPNGTAAVCDQYEQQMGQYQRGGHYNTIRLLAADGYDWRTLEVTGSPFQHPRYGPFPDHVV